jgi:hypothetical protein
VGRQSIVITAAAIAAIFIASETLAQGPPRHFRPRPSFGHGNGMLNPARNRYNQLSPEDREAVRRNAQRWLQMNPEQQKILRERERIRQERMQAEAEAAMRQLGLRLDPNAQGQFEARYLQERRQIERQIRQEMEARRQQELPQLNQRLKSEFEGHANGNGQPVSPSVAPSGSVKPRN